MTPDELARDLGIDAKALRQWLRVNYPRRDDEWHTRWHLTPEMIQAARAHFVQR